MSIRIKRVRLLVQGRPILFSTCGHSPDGTTADKMRAEGWAGETCAEVANACRISSDIRQWGNGAAPNTHPLLRARS